MRAAACRVGFLVLVVSLQACVTRITKSTVREKASRDLMCDEESIKVEPVEGREKTYSAEGCGKKATYRCAEWDSYAQQPICRDAH